VGFQLDPVLGRANRTLNALANTAGQVTVGIAEGGRAICHRRVRPSHGCALVPPSLIAIKSLASVQDRSGMAATSARRELVDHGLRTKKLKIDRNHLSERDGAATDASDSSDG